MLRELKERFGASAGMVRNAINHVKEKVRTLVIATRELHGRHGPCACGADVCVRFAGEIITRNVKGTDGLTAFQRAFQRVSHPRAMRKDLVPGSEQEEYSDHGQAFGRYLPESQESNCCELMYVLCLLIFFLRSSQNQPSRVACTLETQVSWLETGTHLDASAAKPAITRGPSRDHTEQCRTRIIQAMSSDVVFSARVRDAHERMSCQVSDAQPDLKKVNPRLTSFNPRFPHETNFLYLSRMVDRHRHQHHHLQFPLLYTCDLMTVTSTGRTVSGCRWS